MTSVNTLFAADDITRRVASLIIDVFPGQLFDIQVFVEDLGGREQERPAVIAYRFKDDNSGTPNEVAPVHPYSRQLGARFRYVQYDELSRFILTEQIVTPVGATKLEAYVLTWQRKSARSLSATLEVRFVAPSPDLLKKTAQVSAADALLLLEAILQLPLSTISIDSLRTAFDIAWANEQLSLSWKIGRRLLKITEDRGARKTHREISHRLEYLSHLADVGNSVPVTSKPKTRYHNAIGDCVIRILSSNKKKLEEVDMIEEGHLRPATNFSTIFVTPINSGPDFGSVSLWSESTVLDEPWLIQTGLSRSFLSRVSQGLLRKYAYSVMAAKLEECTYGLVHAQAGVLGYELGEIGLELARNRGVPFIFEFDSRVLSHGKGMKFAFREARVNKALNICKRADLVIFFDPTELSVLREKVDSTEKLIYIDAEDVDASSLQLEQAYRKVMRKKMNRKKVEHLRIGQ